MNKDIAIIYNPRALTYPSNNPVSFSYPDPVAVKAMEATKAQKSRPLGLLPMKGDLLMPGLNWIDAEYLELGIQRSEKGKEWIERGVLKIVSKRKLKDAKDAYTGTLLDYKREPGAMEYIDIKMIISNTWDRNKLVTIKSQTPAMFEGEGIEIVQRACDEQIKRIDSQFGEVVDGAQFYKSLQTA